jgi:resuscitation-promoting factor RpfB
MASRVNGFSVAYTVAGGVILWSGVKGSSISDTFRSVLAGNTSPPVTEQIAGSSPAAAPVPAAPGDTSAHGASAAANQAIARILAAPYGWSAGQQWADLVSLWNRESGWSNTAENPSSGAYGIAQALGHGPTDQYPAGPANPPVSSASAQIAWGLSYIKQTYGSPSAAWAHEESEGWY